MELLVFGRTGQVARALARLVPEAVFLDRAAADLMQPETCAAAILARSPAAVINAAAYTAVDKAETEADIAHTTNALAPAAMARACAALDIPFLTFSTDYVFDGSGEAPWKPDDAPAPLNAYGRGKLAGEEAVRAAGGQAAILRASWIFSMDGANFVKTMLHLSESRDRLHIVDDQIGGPTHAEAVARAALRIIEAMLQGQPGGTWHIAGRPYVSWAEFARWVFRFAERDVVVMPITSAEYPTAAPRPLNSRLDCTTLARDFALGQPDWKAALRADIRRMIT